MWIVTRVKTVQYHSKLKPVQESVQEETEASRKTSDPEPVEASAGTEQTDVSSEPDPDPSENKESKEEK